jgi:glucose-6-phosphate 1-dehydrogenase
MNKAMIIFGSTGNLMYKKLIPAIHQLTQKKLIKDDFKIYAIARTKQDLDRYINQAKDKVKEYVDWDKIKSMMEYIVFDVNELEDYKALNKKMEDQNFDDISIYLALPPSLFPIVAKGVSLSGLISKEDKHKRIVFEKPFGENLESAKSINRILWNYFNESQIYRIDHYLGKEMIQNILVVRYANIIFEKVWSNDTIESITILSKEEEGVLSRGGYYDKIGALKDMLQSHLLQMAALVLMNKPKQFDSESIKDEKVKIFESLKLDDLVLGQYEGYKETEKVNPDSKTETFAYAKVFVNDERWQGVPIHFITGKKLDEKRSEIIIHFKEGEKLGKFFPNTNPLSDQLIIKVSPKEGVEFRFSVKEVGLSNDLKPAVLDYCHNCKALENTPEAYERLLLDMMNDQRTLFTRWDEIEYTWKFIDSIKNNQSPMIYKTYEDLIEIMKEKGVNTNDL